MKVAWLCSYPVGSIQGAPLGRSVGSEHPSTWIVTLAQALVRHVPDLELHLVTGSPRLTCNHTVEQDGFTLHAVRTGAVPCTCRGWPPWLAFDVAEGYASHARAYREVLNRIHPDVVHGHGTEGAFGLSAIGSGFPAVISIQGIINRIFEDRQGWWWQRRKELERRCIQGGKFFICKTPFAREFVSELNPQAAIAMVENPVHPAFFAVRARPQGGRRLVFVGSLTPEKGIAELVESLADVPNASLTVIGTGPDSFVRGLHRRAEALGVTARIQWAGYRDSRSIAAIFSESHALVLPSHMETSPNVVAEAMCAGLPVVATRVGGVPHMVNDGVTGLLVEPHDARGLAAGINRLLEDPARAAAMGTAAADEAKTRFDPAVAAAKVLAAYRNVLSGVV